MASSGARKALASIIFPSASLGTAFIACNYVTAPISSCDVAQVKAPSASVVKENEERDVLLEKKRVLLKKRMTPIGRFSLKSETASNPSIPTFFMALSSNPTTPSNAILHNQNNDGQSSMTVKEFESLWYERNIPTLHPRFHSKVSSIDGYFDFIPVEMKRHVKETLSLNMYREDLKKRVETFVSSAIDVKDKLWELQISSGELGSSGAISRKKVEEIYKEKDPKSERIKPLNESLLLFRCHHSLGDGVSLTAALGDLFDEAQLIKDMIQKEIQKRKDKLRKTGFLKKLLRKIQKILWFVFGSIQALMKHAYLVLSATTNPFLQVIDKSSFDGLACGRTISWCDVASVEEVKQVAKKLGGKNATVNDVFVSCVSAAVARQLAEHRRNTIKNKSGNETKSSSKIIHKKMNVVIPVHLTGGILPPGHGLSNLIGAFVTKIPCEMENASAKKRLLQVHDNLYKSKHSMAPVLSYYMAKFISIYLPESLAVPIFHRSSANAAVAVTNSRGYEKKLHINGRAVESMAGFLPLPPGLPVGIVVHSYGSIVSLSINAEKWAVPDADLFLTWILDEYKKLCIEAER
mmetsp:Transcript_31982/g.37286  ORF Transcript_31982/g.37286 Transcript_31982/m.37286 type:complete len:578 (-) Transcript_31982:20-1753(-)